MIQILLIHNPFNPLDKLTYLSYGIRVVTCSKWNHVAIRIDDKVYEAIGTGVIVTNYDEWLVYKNRQVLPLTPKKRTKIDIEAVTNCIGIPYGFLDLVDRFNCIRQERWNGNTHVHKEFSGVICSDLGTKLLRIEEDLIPCDFDNRAGELGLTKGEVYRTYRS